MMSIILSIAAIFLGLAIIVQALQEIYKYLTSSRARTYANVLVSFLGPWAEQLMEPGVLPDLQVSSPFQIWRRSRPTGRIQPMEKDDLVSALERTTAPWIRRALRALRTEVDLQQGTPQLSSASLGFFRRELESVTKGAPGANTANDIQDFLKIWISGKKKQVDARVVLAAFRHRFLPQVVGAETHHAQFMKNFDLSYRRRNLRQTFTLSLLLALACGLSFDRIYETAQRIPIEEARAVAERITELYSQQSTDAGEAAIKPEIGLQTAATVNYLLDGDEIRALLDFRHKGPAALLRYLLGCIVTAILICFGAPFWNDLASLLLRSGRPATAARKES